MAPKTAIDSPRPNRAEVATEPFPFDPKTIDAVILSHAHIDHSGRLPLLVKRGYDGPIYAQNATKDLCQILLEDSANLSERDAEYANRKRAKKKGKGKNTKTKKK